MFQQQQAGELIYYTASRFIQTGGVAHGFSTRLGGVSLPPWESLNLGRSRGDNPEFVKENHLRFSRAIGSDVDGVILCQQVHSDVVRVVTEEDRLSHLYDLNNFEADAMVTNCPGLVLTVFYADCIPVLLYDPRKQAIGAVHSGWRGTALGIVRRAVETMAAQYDSAPEDILAAIGPGICPRCFETHVDVPEAMNEALGMDAWPFIYPLSEEKYGIDLKGLIALQLEKAGLNPAHIDCSDLCTACHPEEFWSHRRLGEDRGNQAAMIQLLDKKRIFT